MHHHKFTDWLIKRHISRDILADFSISIVNHHSIGESIIIHIHDGNGVFLFNKYRRDPFSDRKPKYLYDLGSSAALFGWNKAKEHDSILVCEGELDALVAWSHAIPAVTSTGGAGTFNKEWAELLADKKVVICYDNDRAGAEGMVKVLRLLPQSKVLLLPDAPHIKDLSDYVQYGGDLNTLLFTARHFDDTSILEDRAERIALFKSTHFHDAWIQEATPPVIFARSSNTVPNSDIEKARAHPLTDLLKFNKQKKASCIWHNDTTPSLHYYSNTNTCYCFGCGKHGDSIDVYRKLHDCSFKQALNDL